MFHSVRARWLTAVVFAAAIAPAAIGSAATSSAASLQPTASVPAGFVNTEVWKGLSNPTAVAFAPNGRVFVAEKAGVVKVFASTAAKTPTVWSSFPTQVNSLSDRGLLGLAVDPKLGTTGHNFVYVLYTLDALPGGTAPKWNDKCPTPPGADVDGCVVTGNLAQIAVNPDGSAGATKVIIKGEWCQQFTSHSIGHLAFGADGDLYVTGGDGASYTQPDWGQLGGTLKNTPTPANPCGDPPGGVGTRLSSPTARGGALRAQSTRRPAGEPVLLNGALLRINPKTGAGVPGNPMYNAANKKANASRIIAYGFRNPFRFTFRPGTSEIWVADVGWNTWEEVNRVTAPTVKPTANFGWPCYEGTPKNNGYAGLNMCKSLYADTTAPATAPFDTYNHSGGLGGGDTCGNGGGSSVISAIAFAPSNTHYPAAYKGALFFGDHSRSCIWVEFPGSNGLPSRATLKTFVDDSASPAPVDIEADPASGDLFYIDIDAGSIHRVSFHG